MIKNYKIFKESLLDKLKGPTKEEITKLFLDGSIDVLKYLKICRENNWDISYKKEVWEYLGFNKIFDTPKEFLDFYLVDIEMKQYQHINSIYWYKDDKMIFRFDQGMKYLYMCKTLTAIFRDIFDLREDELQYLLWDFMSEPLDLNRIKKFHISYVSILA